MKAYLDILRKIKETGVRKESRTGIDTMSITGAMFEHDMREGFPIQTTKKMGLKTISWEDVCFIRGLNDKQWLKDHNVNIWNQWANPKKVPYGHDAETQKKMAEENDLGEIYGVQWRQFNRDTEEDTKKKVDQAAAVKKLLSSVVGDDDYDTIEGLIKDLETPYEGVDQLKNVIDKLKSNPFDRRMIVNAWNPAKLDQMALPPCHYSFQILSDGKHVDLLWNQRSVDTPLGLPFNIAGYGLILELIAKHVGMIPRKLIGFLADVHYYVNQQEGVDELLSRTPGTLPKLVLTDEVDIFTWEPPAKASDMLEGYDPQPAVSIPIAI